MYKSQATGAQQTGSASGTGSSDGGGGKEKEDVVEAEFEEVDKDKKDS
jgi:hypothetical protein